MIRDLAARVLSGQSLNGVATDWRQREIHTLSGNYRSAQSLRQMLLSPSIAGYRTHHGKHRPAYGGCGRVSRDAETIESLIVEALFVAVESDDFDRLASSPAGDPTRKLYESLAHDQGLLDRLADKVAEELITIEFAKRKRAEIEDRMQETRSKLARLGSARAIAGIPRNLRDEWPNYSVDRRRAILGAVLNKVTVYSQGSLAPFDPDLIDPDWKV